MSTVEELQKQLAQLQMEISKLKAEKQDKPKGLTMKVSEKKALSVYGLNRFPVTLYKDQWKQLLDEKDTILKFIQENDKELLSK